MRNKRFEWIQKAVIREWYPLFLKGQSEEGLHIVLESNRWEELLEGNIIVKVQYVSSQENQWKTTREYHGIILRKFYEDGSSITMADDRINEIRKI